MSVDQALKDSQTATERAVKEAGYLKKWQRRSHQAWEPLPQVSDEALYMTDLPTVLGNRLVLRLGNNPALGQPEMAHCARPLL